MSDLELLMLIGSEVDVGHWVRERDYQTFQRELKHVLHRARRLVGKRVVVADGRVVTAITRAERQQIVCCEALADVAAAIKPCGGHAWQMSTLNRGQKAGRKELRSRTCGRGSANNVLSTYRTQAEAIVWAKARGHLPLVARVRNTNKGNPRPLAVCRVAPRFCLPGRELTSSSPYLLVLKALRLGCASS